MTVPFLNWLSCFIKRTKYTHIVQKVAGYIGETRQELHDLRRRLEVLLDCKGKRRTVLVCTEQKPLSLTVHFTEG